MAAIEYSRIWIPRKRVLRNWSGEAFVAVRRAGILRVWRPRLNWVPFIQNIRRLEVMVQRKAAFECSQERIAFLATLN
jgi:hypothetical protein